MKYWISAEVNIRYEVFNTDVFNVMTKNYFVHVAFDFNDRLLCDIATLDKVFEQVHNRARDIFYRELSNICEKQYAYGNDITVFIGNDYSTIIKIFDNYITHHQIYSYSENGGSSQISDSEYMQRVGCIIDDSEGINN